MKILKKRKRKETHKRIVPWKEIPDMRFSWALTYSTNLWHHHQFMNPQLMIGAEKKKVKEKKRFHHQKNLISKNR